MDVSHDLDFLDFVDEESQLHDLERVVDFDCIGNQQISDRNQTDIESIWDYDENEIADPWSEEPSVTVSPTSETFVIVSASNLPTLLRMQGGNRLKRAMANVSALATS